MRLESPLALLLLLVLPLFFRRKETDKLNSISFSPSVVIAEIPQGFRARLRSPILRTLQIGTFALLVIGLARPQAGTQFTEIEASGRDIILALDTSGSMQALDFSLGSKTVNRLTALKSVVKEFIIQRRGDRMGLTVFGEHAYTQCPLTLDTNTLLDFVELLQIGISGQATAIGDAIAVSLKQIRDIDSDSKVIILVTDGKSNAGSLSPREAAVIAKELGVKIHTVGIGGEGYAPFPAKSFFGRDTVIKRRLDYDEKTLKDIADTTGGKYFNAQDTDELKQVYAQINKLEERVEKEFEYVEYEDQFFGFVVTGLVLFLAYELLSATIFLQIP